MPKFPKFLLHDPGLPLIFTYDLRYFYGMRAKQLFVYMIAKNREYLKLIFNNFKKLVPS